MSSEVDPATDSEAPNIILTGFMGTGKTSVGRLLAETLGYDFIDSDALIEEEHGSIASIFGEWGEDGFRAIERQVAAKLATRSRTVIATGGRLMLDDANAAALSSTGLVVCLSANLETLAERLLGTVGGSARPLLADGPDPAARIAELVALRASGYAKFPQVETDNRSLPQIVAAIIDRLDLQPIHRLPVADS